MEMFHFVPSRRYVAASKSQSACLFFCFFFFLVFFFIIVLFCFFPTAFSGSACKLPRQSNSAGAHGGFLPINS